jgi:hypothetical protein
VGPAAAIAEAAPAPQENSEPEIVQIRVEATITDLSDEQRARFRDYIEWWNAQDGAFYTSPEVEGVVDGGRNLRFFGELRVMSPTRVTYASSSA